MAKSLTRKDEPLEFVTVRIAGTAIGATSGLDGTYSLSVPQRDTINVIFTCIGYNEIKRQLIDPAGDVTLNVKMTQEVDRAYRGRGNRLQEADQPDAETGRSRHPSFA